VTDLLDQIFQNPLFVFVLPALLLLGCAELGVRLGLRVHASRDAARKGTIGGIQGAVLGLLGLLLGFTFAMAISRYDARRLLVVQDANAIGTAYLRASLLPDEHVQPVEDLLRRYVDLRIEYQSHFDDRTKFAEGLRQSAEVQRQIWQHAVAAAKEAPTATVASAVASFNDVFDTETERLAAAHARIPGGVWAILMIVACVGCLTSGYAAGAEGIRSSFSSLMLPFLIAIALFLIFDLNHPRHGLIGLSQQPLLDLQRSLAPPG
jgi:hypothetical protein